MPVPETDINEKLYALRDDRSSLSPNMMRQWNQSPLRLPAEECRAAIEQAGEEINNALERQHYHAGPQPEGLVYWWQRVQNSVEKARVAALAAQTLCAEPGDPGTKNRRMEIWKHIDQELAAAHAEARVQRAYWQGVMDAAPAPE